MPRSLFLAAAVGLCLIVAATPRMGGQTGVADLQKQFEQSDHQFRIAELQIQSILINLKDLKKKKPAQAEDIDKLIAQFDTLDILRFSIEGKMNFWKQIQEFKAGKNNSWAIRWYASIFLKGGLTLNPARSLINNIGHDGTGVHSNRENMYDVHISQQPVKKFPDIITENEKAYNAIKHFLAHRKGNLWQRAVRFVRQKVA